MENQKKETLIRRRWPNTHLFFFITEKRSSPIGGVPCFTEEELHWMQHFQKRGLNAEEFRWAWNARREDGFCPIKPEPVISNPVGNFPQDEATVKAREDFGKWVQQKFKM